MPRPSPTRIGNKPVNPQGSYKKSDPALLKKATTLKFSAAPSESTLRKKSK